MKKILNKAFKFLRMGIITIFILCILFLLTCFVNNQIQLRKEAAIIKSTGKIVQVNGYDMHVYSEGQGNLTCVFMSGSSICASNLEFKGLYTYMSNEYRIAVVDRASYGFSEAANDSRDIDTMLEETRQALTAAGEKAPYILFPHSISGLEAIYWAQKYPDEVKAIIGLDIGLPEEYAAQSFSKSDLFLFDLQAFLVRTGVHRLVPSITYDSTIINDNFLSKDEKELYKALCYRNLFTEDMVNELKSLQANAKKSIALKLPTQTPILIFSAFPYTNDQAKQRSITVEQRDQHFNKFVSRFNHGKVLSVRGKHCIYLYAPKTIAKESKAFILSIAGNH
ncbi:MAG: alpha/beta hydrolase [Clostridia bacterium]|nr:alpha/beta hydrolase [Clostridia bacterium]